MPDGVYFKDEKDNRWVINEGSFRQIDYDAGDVITLNDEAKTKLTAKTDYSLTADFKLPDGVEFTDEKGNKWVTNGGSFHQTGFAANTLSLTLNSGLVLTNVVPYERNADGTIPAGVLFKDNKNGRLWVSGGNGLFSVFDSSTTPVSSLQVFQNLQGKNAKDAAAILAQCDPTIAKMILTGGSYTDQQITDTLKEMSVPSAVAILTKLKITNATKFNQIMALLNVGQITTEMSKVPSSKIVSSTDQTSLKTIYNGIAPVSSTREDITDGVLWKYYDKDGNLIGSRTLANPLVQGYDAESYYHQGFSNTYYDINGTVIKKDNELLQPLSGDQTLKLADIFGAAPVYAKSVQTVFSVGGYNEGGYTEYYDGNGNLLGTQGWSTRWDYLSGTDITTLGSFVDKNGNLIAIGTATNVSNQSTGFTNTTPTIRTITAGSAEETQLKGIFGVVPATVHEFSTSVWNNGSHVNYSEPGYWTGGSGTTYYDANGNFLGSKRGVQEYVGTWIPFPVDQNTGYYTMVDHWFDQDGDLII
jgi:hypothetical protein